MLRPANHGRWLRWLPIAVLLVVATACSQPSGGGEASKPTADASGLATSASGNQTSNVYADAGPNMLSPAVRGQRVLVYVPNHGDRTVSVIDPKRPTE